MEPKTKKAKVTKQITEKQVAKNEEEIINPNFSLQVAIHIIQQHLAQNESVVCSPVSIDTILSILAVGAENSTLDQLLKVLGHVDVGELNEAARKLADIVKGSDDEDGPQISSANAVWLDRRFSLKAAFKNVLRDVHDAQVRVVDFVNKADQVVKEANAWAKEKTKGLIKQILTENNINNTCLLLANALYFKGTWHKPFVPRNTKDDDFHLLNGNKVRVPFMNQWNQDFEYGTSDECQVLKKSYKTRDWSKHFSMYFFLPYEKNGLPNLMGKMMIDPNSFVDQVKLNFAEITKLSIPRFKFESKIDLKQPMKELGLTLPFEEDCRDFSGIIDNHEPLYVSDVFQKCFVETNERGTEAAAVTVATMMNLSCSIRLVKSPPIKFVADHPFMFMIRDDISGATLFVGTMLNPK